MVYETKMRKNAGSMITVVPAALVNLVNAKSGDKLRWEVSMVEKGVNITIIPIISEE